MADTNQDKTEQATSKRQSEARDSGQVAYSKELTAAILFLAGIATLKWVGGDIATALFAAMRRMLMLPVHLLNETSPGPFLATIGREILTWLWPVFAIGMISTLGPGMAQTKLAMSFKKLKPDLSKLDPIKGVKKLFSLDSVINVMASALKMFLVGYLVWYTIDAALPRMMTLTSQGLGEMIDLLLELIFLLGFRVGAGLATIGFLDVLYRQWKNGKDLMMTKEEVKEERKSAEGDPKIKSKIRSIQRAMALQRMKTDVKGADVVVRNPTHYAVALKYDREKDSSPRVVAKGRALMALTIIRIAEENGVTVIEDRPLAREMYRSVKLGDLIPERLFRAVAEILAHVYRKKNGGKSKSAGAR